MEGVVEKAAVAARRCVQGEAVALCRTDDWKADEASIAREGRGILRIAAAMLRWMSSRNLDGQMFRTHRRRPLANHGRQTSASMRETFTN